MATLEDAAEELVVRLKGLDSEIEESHHALEELRGQVEDVSKEVEEEWSALTGAVSSFMDTLRQEQERLAAEAQEALQATAGARAAVRGAGAEASTEAALGQADLEALSRHATALEATVESLVAESGEAPAHDLAARVHEVERELAQVLEEACEFLREDVTTALGQMADDVRERCHALRSELAEEGTAALQAAYDEWTAKLDELDDMVSAEAFEACQQNADAVVDWALEKCRTAGAAHLDAVEATLEESARPLLELAGELQEASTSLAAMGAELLGMMDGTGEALAAARSALGSVRDLLATFTFVQG